MSNQYFGLKWQDAINDLMEQIQIENFPLEQNEEKLGMQYKRTELEWFQHFAALYIRYIECYRKLEDCFDQLVHPQKKELLQKMLESTMVRLCESKNELVRWNVHSEQKQNDLVNLDDMLMNLKLSPEVLEIPCPRYFRYPTEEKNKRNQLIDKQLMMVHGTIEPEEEKFEERQLFEGKNEVAIRILQKNERGRQGIERTKICKYKILEFQKKQAKLERVSQNLGGDADEGNEQEEAIEVIQKYYRGFKAREEIFFMRQKVWEFLQIKKPFDSAFNKEKQDFENHRKQVKIKQIEHDREYNDTIQEQLEFVKNHEGPDIEEQMLKDRREWYNQYIRDHEHKEVPDNYKDFYERLELMQAYTAEELEQKRAEEELAAKEAKKKKEAKKGGKGKQKKSELEEFLEAKTQIGPSGQVKLLQQQVEQHTKDWGVNDEAKNFEQRCDIQLVKQLVRPQVEDLIKDQVDEMIQIELENKRADLNLKKKKKKKKGKKKKKKGKKKKKVPGQASCKNRDPRDMLTELIEAGVVKKLLPAQISDFKGAYNNLGCLIEKVQAEQLAEQEMRKQKEEQQEEGKKKEGKGKKDAAPKKKKKKKKGARDPNEVPSFMPDPSMAQLRQIITEYIAIPLGSLYAKQNLKRLTQFLFYGPMGSGKTLLVRALAYQCDAMVIDLTPSYLEGKNYSDKASTNKLMYMAFACAREFQPAIIIFDEAETVFPGGKKKKSSGPARLKKPLQDFKKAKFLEETDRVCIIGCTNRPQDASVKDIKNYFDKKLYFPYPNYSTRKLLFQHFVEDKHGVQIPDSFPLCTLAHVTEGYTAGSFQMAVDQVLTARRMLSLKERPLSLQEFIGPISSTFYLYAKEYEKIQEFTDDVTGLKERRKKPEKEDDKKKKGKKKK